MFHSGSLPTEFCFHECPYRKPRDFFSDTESLLLKKERSGEYTPRPRSCGGCGTVKRRVDAVQFVYPYWHQGAAGDELRWSIRSVEQHFEGAAKITIVGDRPPWWKGHVIEQARVDICSNRAFRDMLAKMQTISVHPEIDSDFVWMMDDIYFVKPVTLEEIQTPRAYRWKENHSNSWQKRKTNTMRVLHDAGFPQHDYATHMPHHAEKSKLRELFARYDLTNNTLLWEVLYGNSYRSIPCSPYPFFARCDYRATVEQYRQKFRLASVMNHTSDVWCPGMRQYLEELFPIPSAGETDEIGYVPTFRKGRNAARPVKRRPPHTHRAVREAAGT